MGIFDFFKKKQQENVQESPLVRDIHEAAQWIITALNSSGYKADYTLEAMKEVDRFFDEQNTPDGIINTKGRGQILFALGSLVGDTIIKLYGGHWVPNKDDPDDEINVAVELDNGTVMWPIVRCMKRYQNGDEDSIYAYVYVVGKQ